MNLSIAIRAAASLGVGYLVQMFGEMLGSTSLQEFIDKDLVTILIALLAINSTTLGIVLTKIRELMDAQGERANFERSRASMLSSIRVQVGLIILALTCLVLGSSPYVVQVSQFAVLVRVIETAILVHALQILYDTALSVFVILDYKK